VGDQHSLLVGNDVRIQHPDNTDPIFRFPPACIHGETATDRDSRGDDVSKAAQPVPAIDVHAHLGVPEVDALIKDEPGLAGQRTIDAASLGRASLEVNVHQLDELQRALTDVDTRLAAMDAGGVDIQVVSPVPIPHFWADARLAERITRVTNEAVATHCSKVPDRLLGVGVVPLQHPELAVAELTRAVTETGLRGVQISSSAGPGRELDAAELEPFWARVEELNVPVLIHPWGCTLGARLDGYYLFNTVGNPTETALALSRIAFSGLLDRRQRLRIWAAHGGGYLASYLGRADHAWQVRADAQTCVEPPSSYLRRMWVDSLVYTPTGLRHLVESLGVDRITLGSDYPFDMGVPDPVARLDAAGFDPATVAAIRGRNAMDLLGLEKGAPG
jgi:predicted TIM-barrel fold metal-dependent hydrolase